MYETIKLTDEYASNLSCLFFNFDADVFEYYDMFGELFKDCILSNDPSIAEELLYFDIVFIKLNSKLRFNSLDEVRSFLRLLRSRNELMPIYLIKNQPLNDEISLFMEKCYCIDGSLPTPFDKQRVYNFLYRILKRVVVVNDLESYILSLEEQLNTPSARSEIIDEEIKKFEVKQIKKIDEKRKKDIRFSQSEKISATEFMESLDDTIMDKIENISDELNMLVERLYTFEESSPIDALSLKLSITLTIDEIVIVIDTMGYFQITARAFMDLNNFLDSLTLEHLEDIDKKNMLATMLIGIVKDLEQWIQVIFVERSTEDIHYLDASFSSNILEVENLFVETDNSEDDDLEFF